MTTDSATVKHDLSDSWHSILRFLIRILFLVHGYLFLYRLSIALPGGPYLWSDW